MDMQAKKTEKGIGRQHEMKKSLNVKWNFPNEIQNIISKNDSEISVSQTEGKLKRKENFRINFQ